MEAPHNIQIQIGIEEKKKERRNVFESTINILQRKLSHVIKNAQNEVWNNKYGLCDPLNDTNIKLSVYISL